MLGRTLFPSVTTSTNSRNRDTTLSAIVSALQVGQGARSIHKPRALHKKPAAADIKEACALALCPFHVCKRMIFSFSTGFKFVTGQHEVLAEVD